ncbi:phage portal protein [Actinomadura rupiterrae]|uniref:phage portal protein n=1 Tax=Actinomadura rupiterrae TaxID=559627 RepID=UPI0020A2B299|nr:phage portal protein [Actinomadura rupiterrae]MCP2339174.1 HK97 family phage portal protein [Actinomadura rupiterrae]
MRWPWRRRAESPPGEARTISFQQVWGSGADQRLTAVTSMDTALTLVPVFAATRLLSDSVASLPLQTFRQVGDVRMPITDPALIRDPTQYGTVYDWVHRAMTSLTLRGNAYGLITVVGGNGGPSQIEWLHPDDVEILHDRTDERPQWFFRGRPLDASLLVHIPGYTLPGRVLGLSPIMAYRTTIETGIYAQSFGRDWFQNGSTPAAILTSENRLEQADAKALKQRFRAAAEAREPVVMGGGLEYTPISVPAEESQFLATLKMNATQIASIYGIPPQMMGGEVGKSLTYSTVEQDSLNFVRHTLRPWLVKLETAISGLLASPHFVKFNVDSIIRADLLSRYQAHHLALADGWMSRDEVRALEDRPPLPNGEGSSFTPPVPATSQPTAQPATAPGGTL